MIFDVTICECTIAILVNFDVDKRILNEIIIYRCEQLSCGYLFIIAIIIGQWHDF